MIKEFAEYFSLNIWDWIALLVALSSLCVASFSYVVARRTLTSQKQTEKNTTPSINVNVQVLLFRELVKDMFDSHIKLKAISVLIKNNKDSYIFPNSIWDNLILERSNIHCELFYNEIEKFRYVSELYKKVCDYNSNIMTLKEYAKLNMNYTVIEQILEEMDKIQLHILGVLSNFEILHNIPIEMKDAPFDYFVQYDISGINLNIDMNEIKNFENKYFNMNDPFVVNFDNYSKKTFLKTMDKCVDYMIGTYSRYIINHNK